MIYAIIRICFVQPDDDDAHKANTHWNYRIIEPFLLLKTGERLKIAMKSVVYDVPLKNRSLKEGKGKPAVQ